MGAKPSRLLEEATVSRVLTMPTNAAGQLLAKLLLIGNSSTLRALPPSQEAALYLTSLRCSWV
jgi:hypothetical protein